MNFKIICKVFDLQCCVKNKIMDGYISLKLSGIPTVLYNSVLVIFGHN